MSWTLQRPQCEDDVMTAERPAPDQTDGPDLDARLDAPTPQPPPRREDLPLEPNVLVREGPDAADGADIEDPNTQL
jgi:hypothetical protein